MIRVTCELCRRPPSGVHDDFCPRSRASQAALREAMGALAVPMPSYPGIGPFVALSASGEIKTGFNPGVPRVRASKKRTAGGLPRGVLTVVLARDATGQPTATEQIDKSRAAELMLRDFPTLGAW
jgi:hypothetical protein